MGPRRARPTPISEFCQLPSIIHLHSVADFLDLPTFFQSIPRSIPIVWTLHDMNPFTGGCHYTGGCDKFGSHCHRCPQLNFFRGPHDIAWHNFEYKKSLFAGREIHVVTNSTWLQRQAERSALFSKAASMRTIHCGIDTQTFRPYSRQDSRIGLGIQESSFVIGYGAISAKVKRKGRRELEEMLKLLPKKEEVLLLSFGGRSTGCCPSGVREVCLGIVSDSAALARAYSAMDAFVLPSLEEAFGLVALEALACGVPVVAFDGTGVEDLIKHQISGTLVRSGDVKALANAVENLRCERSRCEDIEQRTQKEIVHQFNLERQGADYKSLYEEIVAG